MQSVAELPKHSNIVFYYRAWQEDSYVFTQMDYCSGGTLKQKLDNKDNKNSTSASTGAGWSQPSQLSPAIRTTQDNDETRALGVEELLTLALEVSKGLSFLEDHSILHLDIKPENIYLDANGTYHIGDFGLAVLGSDPSDWEEGDGRYLAPELLNDDAKATAKADVYSFGAVLYECATSLNVPRSRASFTTETHSTLQERVPMCLSNMIMSMLSLKPKDRPSADEITQTCKSIATLLNLDLNHQ